MSEKEDINTLGTPKSTKQTREKLRNLQDSYKKGNNRKSEFPPFHQDLDLELN